MIDKEVIQEKISIVEKNLEIAKEIGKQELEKFSENYRDILAAKHALLESIEACLDIANHIISEKGFRRPEDYKDMFKILEENKIISNVLFNKLIEMAKFRNLLVHKYAEIENKKLHVILQKNLIDIENFLKAIAKFLESG